MTAAFLFFDFLKFSRCGEHVVHLPPDNTNSFDLIFETFRFIDFIVKIVVCSYLYNNLRNVRSSSLWRGIKSVIQNRMLINHWFKQISFYTRANVIDWSRLEFMKTLSLLLQQEMGLFSLTDAMLWNERREFDRQQHPSTLSYIQRFLRIREIFV